MSISSSLLAKLIAAQSDSERRWIVTESLLQSLPDDLATALWAVAIPHWFDAEILAALCPELADRAEDLYQQLQEISCVEVFAERGHNVHELTRNQLLNRLWQTKPDSFRELSARAASYFRNRDKPETQIEWSYHLLIANPTSAYQMLCSFWIKWGNRNAGIELESLLESLIVNLQQQIDANRSTFVVSNFIDYLRDESSAFNVSDELSQPETIKKNLNQTNTSLSNFGSTSMVALPTYKDSMVIATDRHEAIRKYFMETPAQPLKPDYSVGLTKIGIGVGLVILAVILLYSKQGIPILLGIASGYYGISKFLNDGYSIYSSQKRDYEQATKKYELDYERAEPKPSDEQIDQWMDSDIEKITVEALRRLDLEHDDYKSEPFLLGGPSYSQETKYIRGKDGKTRYSHLNILVVYLTEYHIATYQCDHDMEYGQTTSDKTQEFPYREITNLGTEVKKEKIYLVGNVISLEEGMQEFTLATSGSNVIKVAYKFARNTDSSGELVKIGGEHTITAIRKKLQEYKQKYER